MIFPYIGNFIIPTDELIFFRGVGYHQPVQNLIHVYPIFPGENDKQISSWEKYGKVSGGLRVFRPKIIINNPLNLCVFLNMLSDGTCVWNMNYK